MRTGNGTTSIDRSNAASTDLARRVVSASAIFVLLLAAADAATAQGALELLSDDRFVNAFGEFCFDDGSGIVCDPFEDVTDTPSPAYSPFVGSVGAGDGGFASQTSNVDTTGLSGTGAASGFSDIGYGIGESVYDVSFRLDGPTLVDLSGNIEAFDSVGFGFAESEVRLTTAGQVVYSSLADPFNSPVAFTFSQVLPPGDYRLYVQADGDVSIDASFDFTLTATETPAVPLLGLPAAAALGLTLTIAGAITGRRSLA